jgi:Mrp family chromosome partitioning ATPase
MPGLVECLEDGVSLQDVLLETGLGSLIMLPAGRKVDNPVELMASAKMKNFFEEIKKEFADSFIILDVSPVLPFAEARILSNLVDSVVFVVKEGGCSMRNVNESLEILSNVNVLGLVYNKATAASLSGGYQYYYYDYDSINRYSQPAPAKSWKDRLSAVFKR